MKNFLLFILISSVVHLSVAPPVNQKEKDTEHDKENEVKTVDEMAGVKYNKYLMEVVQVLESDPDFRAKLEKADDADIRTGKIAEQLEFVNHNVRSILDELKREELERLRHLATKEYELKNNLDVDHQKLAEHLDHTNTRSFEIQDLKKLIAKTRQDLAEFDNIRREEFKNHEMQKKFEEEEKLKRMDEEHRKIYEMELEALKKKQKKHEPVHHPGSKQQLEEVWEKQDHMDNEDFNPRTFFYMHDIDGNGVWDEDEVKALFLKELDKLYEQGTPQEDLFRRTEEMERMREHVFNEADLNKDGLISYDEFLEKTKKPNFQQDEGWQALDEQQIYTQKEFENFQKIKRLEMEEMIAKGMVPPHPGNVPAHPDAHAPQFEDQAHPQYQQHPQVMIPQQQYPNQIPVLQSHGQIPPAQQQFHPQIVQQQQFQGQVPQNQQYQQVPVQQLHPGQVPVQQQKQQQPQVSIQQQQPPVQLHQQQGQVPIQQNQPQQNTVNQVPQNAQNAAPQQNNPSLPNPKVPAQQELNSNKIQTGTKA